MKQPQHNMTTAPQAYPAPQGAPAMGVPPASPQQGAMPSHPGVGGSEYPAMPPVNHGQAGVAPQANPQPQGVPGPAPLGQQQIPSGYPASQVQPGPGAVPAPQAQLHPHSAQPMQGQMPGMPDGGQQPMAASQTGVDDGHEGGRKALPRISIHSFCERPDTAAAIQATTRDWRMARTNVKIYMGGLLAAIEYYRNESTPALIIFESALRGPELFAQLEQLAAVCDAGTKVVMIGAVNDIRLYRELMEQGLDEYLVPPLQPLTLISSISELYADPENPFVGKVVAFFGAKGGVGSSTMAHNMAWALSAHMGQETALIDMDSSWGTTGLDFNYDNTKGLEEALADHERLDETLLDRIMVRHTEKLSILPAAASLGSTQPTTVEAYETLVDGVRMLSPLTVLDMPHIWLDWSSQILKSADEIVITATPDLANLRNTKNLVDFLKACRPNDPEPLLILNKTGVPKVAEIPVKDFAAAIGVKPAVVMGYDPVVYTEAANDGKMLCDIKAAAPAFDGIMYLAHRLRTGNFPVQQTGKKGLKLKVGKKDSVEGTEKKSGGFLAKLKKRK